MRERMEWESKINVFILSYSNKASKRRRPTLNNMILCIRVILYYKQKLVSNTSKFKFVLLSYIWNYICIHLVSSPPILLIVLQHSLPKHCHNFWKMFICEGALCNLLHKCTCIQTFRTNHHIQNIICILRWPFYIYVKHFVYLLGPSYHH